MMRVMIAELGAATAASMTGVVIVVVVRMMMVVRLRTSSVRLRWWWRLLLPFQFFTILAIREGHLMTKRDDFLSTAHSL